MKWRYTLARVWRGWSIRPMRMRICIVTERSYLILCADCPNFGVWQPGLMIEPIFVFSRRFLRSASSSLRPTVRTTGIAIVSLALFWRQINKPRPLDLWVECGRGQVDRNCRLCVQLSDRDETCVPSSAVHHRNRHWSCWCSRVRLFFGCMSSLFANQQIYNLF